MAPLGAMLGPAAAPAAARPTAMLILAGSSPRLGARLAALPRTSVSILSATQGSHTAIQPLLDITQGARVSASAYSPVQPPALSLKRAGAGANLAGWAAVRRRATAAPQTLQPGLLASSVPGGAAYVSVNASSSPAWALAADRDGHVARVSLGPLATLAARARRAARSHRLVIVGLPAGGRGEAEIEALLRSRPQGELAVVLQRPTAQRRDQLLWVGVAGLGGKRTLTSATTDQSGLVAAIDLAPTILAQLRIPVPAAMHGARIEAAGSLDIPALSSTMARLNAIEARRMPALAWLLGAVVTLVLLAWPLNRRWALRVGALALLWAPAASLITAALEPGASAEYAILAGSCLCLGALCDLLPWPRALLAPAIVTVVAVSADAIAGTQLLMRSLLGPNPAFGARFHGIGNELKPVLAVLALAAVAAALHPARRGMRAAAAIAVVGVSLAIVEGSTLIGAGVGGAMLVAAGAAVATLAVLPGRRTWRTGAVVLGAPVLALAALAAIDVATAHGTGQLNGSVLHASSASELWDIAVRRYGAAWRELAHGTVPYATGLAVLGCVLGVRHRGRLLAATGGDVAFAAALAGGLAAGVVGALVEDSGPVLLVLATLPLACVAAYLNAPPQSAIRGRPPRSDGAPPPSALGSPRPPSGGAVPACAAEHDLVL